MRDDTHHCRRAVQAWQMGMSSWPVRRTGTPLSSWQAQRILDGVSDRVQADAVTYSRHGCVAARSLISSKSCRKKGQSPTSVTERRTRQRDRLCGSNRRGADGMPSCLRSGKRTPPSFCPSTSPTWWRRMQSPACGTDARRHGHQISADPVQRRDNHQRQ